jgi:hypothetical protein
MKKNTVSVDKVYKLLHSSPLSFTIPSRSTRRFPLLWFDEDNNINRPLRYAVNQKSPFEEEQDGNAIVEPIIFEDGMLRVPKTNPVLQQFLHYHPMNGSVFAEVNYEKDAQSEVDYLNAEVDALMEARSLSLEQLENVSRVLFGKDPSIVSTAELKRDVLIYARQDPKGFLNLINDPMLKLESNVHKYFDSKVLAFRNGNKEVWFNMPSNKRKMMNVPFGADPYTEVALFLQTEEGIDAMKLLDKSMDVGY